MDIPNYVDVDFCALNKVRIAVELDGVEQRYVVAANVKEGWIIRHKVDAHGNIQIDGDAIAEERLDGRVTLRVI